MTERTEYIRALKWFTEEMDKKLSNPKNLKKEHWHNLGLIGLFERLVEEVIELQKELTYHPHDYTSIISECCDISDFSMFLADLARALRGKRRQEAGDDTLR